MEALEYVKMQTHRMNADQRNFVARLAAIPAGTSLQKLEEERLSQLYIWLHMDSGSVANRFWRTSEQMKGRPKKRRR